jgi:hypothetical protein
LLSKILIKQSSPLLGYLQYALLIDLIDFFELQIVNVGKISA